MAKVFRIERTQAAQPGGRKASGASAQAATGREALARDHSQHDGVASRDAMAPMLQELRDLRRLVEAGQRVVEARLPEPPPSEPPPLDDVLAKRLRVEIEAMHVAIEQTKREIATLHVSGFKGPQMARVTDELDAVVQGTLAATDQILGAAETIEREAGMLQSHCRNARDRQAAADIADQVIRIYESCNFQDLTGQRITKVVGTLSFIEERVMGMMAIWGGIASFEGLAADTPSAPEGDASLLNGPRLAADNGHVSQDDIDALFG